MTISKSLTTLLVALLPLGALAPACSSGGLSTKGQLITCTTDPGTGTILRCEPGAGAGEGTCQDVDEDGDGEPHDDDDDADDDGGVIARSDSMDDDDDDSDDDGVPDGEDCDEHHGEDDCDSDSDGGADLPYDVRPQLGATTRPILDAFAAEGAAPAEVVAVTMDGGSWRLSELQAGTAFTVTAADCDHAGNRDTGRDRVFVTWRTADNAVHTDHLDIRYCKN